MSRRTIEAAATISTLLALISPAFAGNFDVAWYTIDCGGVSFSSGGGYELAGTLGQPDAGAMSGGGYVISGGFWSSGPVCSPPELLWAHSIANHWTAPGVRMEFFVDLDLAGNPATRTSECRSTGIRLLEFQFDQDVTSASIRITGPTGLCASGCALALLPGSHGAQSRGRIDLGGLLPNQSVYTMEIAASSGPGCDLVRNVCVTALVGDFNSNGIVSAADRAELVGFIFAPIAQTNARYDLQVEGNQSGRIDAADLGAWAGFFQTSVVSQSCP